MTMTTELKVERKPGFVSITRLVQHVDNASAKIKSKRQLAVLEKLLSLGREGDAIEYLASFQKRSLGSSNVVRRMRHDYFTAGNLDQLSFKAEGSILKRYLKRFDATSDKRPAGFDLGSWLGVEIECFIPLESVIDKGEYYVDEEYDDDGELIEFGTFSASRAADGARERLAELIQENKIPNICVKDDGSIRCDEDEYFTVELAVLFRRGHAENLKALCDLLNKLGAQVNKSCGLHVHLDCRDLEKSKSKLNSRAARLGKALPVLSLMVPESRRIGNQYCKLGVSKFSGSRYYAVNKTAFVKYNTIEVRLHSATTNFEKIVNWCELLFLISRSPKMRVVNIQSFEDLVDIVPDSLLLWVKTRIDAFNPASTRQVDTEDQSLNQTIEAA